MENLSLSTSYRSTAVLNLSSSSSSSSNTSSETLTPESSWRSSPSDALSHSECYKHLINLGFRWEEDEERRNWNISTIWEPSVLKDVSIFQEMKKGEETAQINLESLNKSVTKGFKVFGKNLPTFVSSSSNYIAVRIEQDANKGSKYCVDTDTALFHCTEILVGEEEGGGMNFSTLRCTPSLLFAGGQLAEVLGEMLRPKDVLVVVGPFKKHHSRNGYQRIVLLNFDSQKEQVSIVRFSHLHPHQVHQVRMLESISPRQEGSLGFEYILLHGDKDVFQINKSFLWHAQLQREIRFLAKDIPMPIRFNQEVLDAYYKIVDHSRNSMKMIPTPFQPHDSETDLPPHFQDSPVFSTSPEKRIKDLPLLALSWIFCVLSIILMLFTIYYMSTSSPPPPPPPLENALSIIPKEEENTGFVTIFVDNISSFVDKCANIFKCFVNWLYDFGCVKILVSWFIKNSTVLIAGP